MPLTFKKIKKILRIQQYPVNNAYNSFDIDLFADGRMRRGWSLIGWRPSRRKRLPDEAAKKGERTNEEELKKLFCRQITHSKSKFLDSSTIKLELRTYSCAFDIETLLI